MTQHMTPTSQTTIAKTLADYVSSLRYDDIPEDVRERARYLMLDAVGIGREPPAIKQVRPAHRVKQVAPVLVVVADNGNVAVFRFIDVVRTQ